MGQSTDPWGELDSQLAELNQLASRRLGDDRYPEPDGLPQRGSWIRAISIDDDGHPRPLTPWHYVVGWDRQIGQLSTRCSRRTFRVLGYALDAHLGRGLPQRARRTRLLIAPGAPAEACRQCDAGLASDAAKRAAIELEAGRQDRLAELEHLAIDASIDDAERGRRLRALWARGGVR